MFSKIVIKVFYLTAPEFANNTVPELFVEIVIVVSKLPIEFTWKFIMVFDKTKSFLVNSRF